MSSLQDSYSWSSDYVDLDFEFLGEEEASYLYAKYPNLPKNSEKVCITCEKVGEYVFNSIKTECNCHSQLQLHKHYLAANVGLLYQRLSWQDYKGDPSALKLAQQYLSMHKDMVRTGMGLIYHGEFGAGKTMLVSLIAKELVKLGYDVYFCTFTEMIDQFTKGWGSNIQRARFEQKVVESKVFILDDVGKEFRSKNNLAESTFDHVLRQRAVDGRPTLLTTNMDESELDEGYGGAIFSLLKERSIVHKSKGTDFRTSARERTLEEIFKGWKRPIF